MTEKISITFFGGAGSVTGSNFMLEYKGVRALVDCGLLQGTRAAEKENFQDLAYDPATIPYLFVTHAHLDHVGKIPKLVRDGFKGRIYSTPPTKDLAYLILEDSLGMLEKEAREDKLEPIYTKDDVDAAMGLWSTESYHTPIDLSSTTLGTSGEGVQATLRNSGHVLGSSMIEFTIAGKKVMFTGDLGNSPAPLLKDCEDISDIDVMVMESVYGDRNHEAHEDRREMLEDVIEDTVKRGGVLMIPAFSIERTQEILFEIERMMEESKVPLIPVYLDSPLAIKATAIYKKYDSYLNKGVHQYERQSKEDIFEFPQLHQTLAPAESREIDGVPGAKIIIAGSGMSQGGRIVYHEQKYLGDPKNTLLLVGYQVAGSLGRQLQDGSKKVMIMGEPVTVRAKVLTISGYSAHKDSEALFRFVEGSADTLKRVYMAMGEPSSATFIAQRVRDYLGINAIVPRAGMTEQIEL